MANIGKYTVGFNLEYEDEKKSKIEKIDDLRKIYITLYTQRDAMLTNERDDIYCRYVRLLGKAKYENFKLMVEVRALKMKMELAQAALNRNQFPNIEEIDRITRTKLDKYFNELEEQFLAIKAAEQAENFSQFTVKELKDLYRVLVRRLHPDLHPHQPESMKDLFVKGQAAYRTYDINLLRDIIKRLDMNEPVFKIDAENLDEIMDRLNSEIEEIRSDIENLRDSFPFNLEKDLLDPVWINAQQNAIKEERTHLESQKEMYSERLELLTK